MMNSPIREAMRTRAAGLADITIVWGKALLALLAIVAFGVFLWTSDLTYLALGCGLGSVSLGFTAIEMARKSDRRIEAMANFQFDEKIGVLTDYAEPAQSWVNIYYHTRAALHLERWASKPMKRDFKDALIEAKKEAKSDKDTLLIQKLEDLCQQYNIDRW